MGRYDYSMHLWLLMHLISMTLWIILSILLICVLMSWLCRKRGRMFRCGSHQHEYSGHQCHGHQRQCGGHQCQCDSHQHHPTPSHPLDALEILRQRYAAGEIDDTTFQHMRERLGASVRSEQSPEG